MAKPKEVSHAEVWDDTALVDSWNEALAEYKKYHSLAAKGMKIERVLDDAEKREKEDSTAFQVDADPDGNSEPAVTTASNNKQSAYDEEGVSPTPAALPTHVDTQALPGAAAVPQVLMNNVSDEGLKNLMMSWYYAGYYTGLYEGQQMAYAKMQQRHGDRSSGA